MVEMDRCACNTAVIVTSYGARGTESGLEHHRVTLHGDTDGGK